MLILIIQIIISHALGQEIIIQAPRPQNSKTLGRSDRTIKLNSLKNFELKDLLEQEAGLFTFKSPTSNRETDLFLRGFNSKQIKIYWDDIPMQMGGGDQLFMSQIPLELIDRIEIRKGSPEGLGGSLHFYSKKGKKISQIKFTQGSFGVSHLSAHSFYDFDLFHFSFFGQLKKEKNDYPLPQSYSTDLYDTDIKQPEKLNNNQFTQSTARIFSKYKSWSADLLINETENGIPGQKGQYLGQVGQSDLLLKSKIDYAQRNWGAQIFYSQYSYRYQDPLGEFNDIKEDERTKSRQVGTEINFKHKASLGILNSSLKHRQETFENQLKKINSGETQLQSSFRFFVGDNIFITPFIKHDWHHDLKDVTTYGSSLLISLSSSIEVKSHIHTGYRRPTFQELYFTRGFFVGNPNLKPEESVGGDIGLKWKSENASLGLNYFLYEVRNKIQNLLVSGFQYKPHNFTKTLIEGVELLGSLKSSKWIQLNSTITAQNSLDNDKNSPYYKKRIPLIPMFYGVFKLEAFPTESFKLYLHYSFALNRFNNTSNTKILRNRHLIDFGTDYILDSSWSFNIEVKNIFDRENNDTRGYPLPGRGYYANTTYTF